MSLRTFGWITLALPLLAAGPAVSADEQSKAEKFKVQTYRIGPKEKVPHPRAQKRVDKYRKKHEVSDQTLEVVVEAEYLTGQERVRRWAKRITPLDEKGRPHGPVARYKLWHGIQHLITYRHGTRHGLEKHWAGPPHGKQHLTKKIPWKDGKIEGKRRTYHPNGEVMTVTPYKDGEESGLSKSYDQEGRLQRTVRYKNGEKHGTMKDLWPETGGPRRLIPYDHGKVHGTVKEFYKNGQLKRVMNFDHDTMHGPAKHYKPDGKLRQVQYWLHGEQVSKQRYQAKADGAGE